MVLLIRRQCRAWYGLGSDRGFKFPASLGSTADLRLVWATQHEASSAEKLKLVELKDRLKINIYKELNTNFDITHDIIFAF